MFLGCKALTQINLTMFNTVSVMDMSSIFYGCSKLEDIDFNFNTDYNVYLEIKKTQADSLKNKKLSSNLKMLYITT